MNPLVLAARERRNVLRSLWRNRSGASFTILLPVMFLLLFGAINRDGTVQLDPHGPQIGYTTFFAPGMLGMAIMAGTFVSLVIGLTVMRDNGQLKRLRGTPLPPSAAAIAFPLAPLLDGMRQALILGHGLGAVGTDLSKLLAWLVVGLVVALRTFRWEQAA
jgi:ABC-2 type transport system permease protein